MTRSILSLRTVWSEPANLLSSVREELLGRGVRILDLTISNPTVVGLDYPQEELESIWTAALRQPYAPDPRGLLEAREALARHLSSDAQCVSPDDLALTASTSEAYSFLFKLFGNPGDVVLTARPSYPLLDYLARLESLSLEHFPLERDLRWALHAGDVVRAIEQIPGPVCAVTVVHPNNPTGSYLQSDEADALAQLCESQSIPLISDEVFFDFPLSSSVNRAGPIARGRESGLIAALGGLSKSAGLPHWKLGWIELGGEARLKREAVKALELIGDTFLSVGSPVQNALPAILRIGPVIRKAISERTLRNLTALSHMLERDSSVRLLPVEGGWSAVIRLPNIQSDEDLAVGLLRKESVLVHPGYFFDFESEGFVVLSLLPKPEVFDEGVNRLLRHAGRIGMG